MSAGGDEPEVVAETVYQPAIRNRNEVHRSSRRSNCRRCANGARTCPCCSSISCLRGRAPFPGSPRRSSASQLSELMTHSWRGNVRELQNVADRFVLGLTGDSLLTPGGNASQGAASLGEQLAYFERMLIEDMLRAVHNGNGRVEASVELGMPKKDAVCQAPATQDRRSRCAGRRAMRRRPVVIGRRVDPHGPSTSDYTRAD